MDLLLSAHVCHLPGYPTTCRCRLYECLGAAKVGRKPCSQEHLTTGPTLANKKNQT